MVTGLLEYRKDTSEPLRELTQILLRGASSLAYFLYSWRWLFRILLGLMVVLGLKSAFSSSKWLPIIPILALLGIAYETNFVMAADTMFYQPKVLAVKNIGENKVENDRLVIGVTHQGQAKSYPIQYLGYHHQVRVLA